MAKQERFHTAYPGVFFIEGKAVGRSGTERIYYIRYKREGKLTEEKAGRQYQDDMTPARAAGIRAQRIEGKQPSNQTKREMDAKEKNRCTIAKLWDEYKANLAGGPNRSDLVILARPFGKNLRPSRIRKQLSRLDLDRLRITF